MRKKVEGNGAAYELSIQRVPYDVNKVIRLSKEQHYPNMEFLTHVWQTGRLGR